jgi:hypothetical protein
MDMTLTLPVAAWLDGGSVMVSVGEPEAAEGQEVGFKLTRLVEQLIEGFEAPTGNLHDADVAYLDQVAHELGLATEMLRGRLRAERAVQAARAS